MDISRRGFLKAIGIGGGAVAAGVPGVSPAKLLCCGTPMYERRLPPGLEGKFKWINIREHKGEVGFYVGRYEAFAPEVPEASDDVEWLNFRR